MWSPMIAADETLPSPTNSHMDLHARCRAYIFPAVKNVPVDVSAHAQ